MRLWNFIKAYMLQNPNQLICENNLEINFKDTVLSAEMFSKKLKGIKCCAILCDSEIQAAMALLGCFVAGVIAVPLSVRYGEIYCNKILDAINPDAVITDKNGKLQITRINNSKFIEPKVKPALIMCTSGTTGTPKGAMLSEKNIISNVSDISDYFSICKEDTLLISRPLYHCAVLTGEFLTALVKGTKIRFFSGQFNPAKVLELIADFKITAFCGTPTLLSMMARLNHNNGCSSLKHICISGECMGKETGEQICNAFPNADIYHSYGLTEACPRVLYLPPHLFKQYPDCVGIPLKSVSVKITDKDGKSVPTGSEGILWVKGKNVMSGYYNNPEKTAEVLKDGWLCTKDIAVKNRDGLIKIKGRNDDMIIKAGMNIYPQEIESALKIDSRVKEALVYAENNKHLGVRLVLNIVGEFSDKMEVKELCQVCLPAYQMPTKINLLKELPKNGSGKIIRSVKNA